MKIICSRIVTLLVVLLLFFGFFSSVSAAFLFRSEKGIDSSMVAGDYYNLLPVDGRLRSYHMHIPKSYDHSEPVPLVFVLHGSGVGSNSYSLKKYLDMDEKSEEEGFIAVYPNGEFLLLQRYYNHPIAIVKDLYAMSLFSREWNRWDDNDIDDVNYIRMLIKDLKTKLNIDEDRIYVTGISAGAMMSYRLGAELSDQIAAIAPVAGTIGGIGYVKEPADDPDPYIISEPFDPVPVISLHGQQDISVPFDGGWKRVFTWKSDEIWVFCVPVPDSIEFWVEHNGCNPVPEISYSESGRVITYTYEDTGNDADVVLVSYEDGGHEWFNAPPYDYSATDLIWEFFEQHPKQ